MRVALTKTLAVAVLAAPVAAPAALAGTATPPARTRAGTGAAPAPTRAQAQTAVRRAERSRALWATVNICDSRRYPNAIGVRGQMPALGFQSSMSLDIQVNYYSRAKHRFVPSPHARMTIPLRPSSTRLEQGGSTFMFAPRNTRLDATVQFVWRRSGRLLGETTRTTTAGHPDADFGSPPHFSAATCRLR